MIQIGQARAQSIIEAPLETIDLGEWMFTLTSEEYAACARGHQSAAQGVLPSGKRVSINVERVGDFFMIQHYVEHTTTRDHVIGVSPNTVLWINDEVFVLAQITWELRVTKLDQRRCELTCTVTAETANQAFAERVAQNVRDTPPGQAPLQAHINEETPLFGKDIERKALQNTWADSASLSSGA